MANAHSTTQQIRAAQDANRVHSWPEGVGEPSRADGQMFSKLQQQRAHADWTPADLVELARVAMLICDAIEEHRDLRDEGAVILGGKNGTTLIENPRNRVLSTLNSMISTSLRRLGVTSNQNERRTHASRSGMERGQRNMRRDDDTDDSLLN